MKTIDNLKESLNDLRENSSPYILSDKDYKKAQREARRLTDAILCLEKLPTKERLEMEKSQLDEKIRKFDEGYPSWIKSTPASFYADKDPVKSTNVRSVLIKCAGAASFGVFVELSPTSGLFFSQGLGNLLFAFYICGRYPIIRCHEITHTPFLRSLPPSCFV